MPSKPWRMKSSIAASCAPRFVPVETTLNSLMSGATLGSFAKALAVFTIWMRQALPTKPLTSAIRKGGSRAGHLRNLVSFDQGAKHSGSVPGPGTTLARAVDDGRGARRRARGRRGRVPDAEEL